MVIHLLASCVTTASFPSAPCVVDSFEVPPAWVGGLASGPDGFATTTYDRVLRSDDGTTWTYEDGPVPFDELRDVAWDGDGALWVVSSTQVWREAAPGLWDEMPLGLATGHHMEDGELATLPGGRVLFAGVDSDRGNSGVYDGECVTCRVRLWTWDQDVPASEELDQTWFDALTVDAATGEVAVFGAGEGLHGPLGALTPFTMPPVGVGQPWAQNGLWIVPAGEHVFAGALDSLVKVQNTEAEGIVWGWASGTGSEDIWVSGRGPAGQPYEPHVRHFDGTGWVEVPADVVSIDAIAAIEPGSALAIGTRSGPIASQGGVAGLLPVWRAGAAEGVDDIWATPTGDFLAVGRGAFRVEGDALVPLDVAFEYNWASAIAGCDSSGLAFVVTERGEIASLDATGASTIERAPDEMDLRDVAVSANCDAVAAGYTWDVNEVESPVLLARDAAGVWSALPSPPTTGLWSVWIGAPDDIAVIGYDDHAAELALWDGTAWTTATHPDLGLDTTIVGPSSTDLWITNNSLGASLFHWDGASLVPVAGAPEKIRAMAADGASWLLTSEQGLYRTDGVTFTRVIDGDFGAMAVSSAGQVLAASNADDRLVMNWTCTP